MVGVTGYRLQAEINRQGELGKSIARAQSDISTGRRLQSASDDPAAWARVALIRRTLANQEAWLSNANTASSVADQVSSVLDGLSNSLIRAGDLMIQANNASSTPTDRQSIADELLGIADDIDAAAGTVDSRGLPLFPDDEPLPIPISRVLQVTSTDSKANVFQNVETPTGTVPLSQILRDAATAITQADDATRRTDSATANDAVRSGITHISALLGQHGVRAARIDTVREQITKNELVLDEERGSLEGTDVARTVAQLQADLLSLQAAQAAFAKINSTSLFDLIR